MGRKSSCPTQTPVTSAPVKPTNHASRQPELVPVLPTAWVKSRIARRAVPSFTTASIIWFIISTTRRLMTCCASGSSRSRV